MDEYTFISNSPANTIKFGKRVGKNLPAGSILALIGELGCGKTLLTRGICDGLGVPGKYVSSPTFAFVNEYPGELPVVHIDLYRLETITEEFEIGMLDYLARVYSGVLIVEWAEKMLPLFPEDYLQVQFQVLSAQRRQLRLVSFGDNFERLLGELRD